MIYYTCQGERLEPFTKEPRKAEIQGHSEHFRKILSLIGKEALYISNFEDIVKYIKENANIKDIVLTLGAGTVTNIGPMLVKE